VCVRRTDGRTGGQTDIHTYIQTGRHRHRQTGRQTGKQADKRTNRQTHRHTQTAHHQLKLIRIELALFIQQLPSLCDEIEIVRQTDRQQQTQTGRQATRQTPCVMRSKSSFCRSIGVLVRICAIWALNSVEEEEEEEEEGGGRGRRKREESGAEGLRLLSHSQYYSTGDDLEEDRINLKRQVDPTDYYVPQVYVRVSMCV